MHIRVALGILCMVFLVHVATIQCISHTGQENVKHTVVCTSDTHVPLKEGQGHQTWYKWLIKVFGKLDISLWHIHDLVDLLFNHTRLQSNRIKTKVSVEIV